MKIIEIIIMYGPNYWSVKRQKLVVMKLGLEDLEYIPIDKIKSTLIGHVIEHIALEIQTMAGIIITTKIIADAITAVKQCQQEEIQRQNSHPVDNFNNDKILMEQ